MLAAERIEYIDIAKGLAMLLIIAGHSLCEGYVQNAIYSFHVPLFFFVSGYFFKEKRMHDLVRSNFRRLMVPYFITCALVVVDSILKVSVGKGWGGVIRALIAAFYCCGLSVDYGAFRIPSCGALWFLPALFFAMLFLNFAVSTKHPFRVIAAVSAVSWASAQIFIFPLGIQTGGFASLFLYVGFVERNKLGLLDVIDRHKWILALLVLVWLPCFYWGGLLEMVLARTPVLPLNLVGAFCGVYIFLYLCKAIESLELPFQQMFVVFGQSTLVVLCVHLLDIRLFPWGKIAFLNNGHASTLEAFLLIFGLRLAFAVVAVVCRNRSKRFQAIF